MTRTTSSNSGLRSVGTSPLRHDGVDKVTGRALYGSDAQMPNMLYGKVLRSPHAHALIRSIDTSRAEHLPGVHAVVTGDDLPDPGDSPIRYKAMNQVAQGRVLYQGHAVAAVAAVDLQTAEDALRLIEVDYEPLPAILDWRAAMEPGVPVLHPELRTLCAGVRGESPTNVAQQVRYERGDVDLAFSRSDVVVEREFHTVAVHQGYIEPHAATVSWRADGQVIVLCSTQGHYAVRDEIAAILRWPASRIRVVPMELGGGFGGKTTSWLETLAALLSRKSGRPVKLTMSRAEVFMASGPMGATHVRVRMGATRAGKICAVQASLVYEAGAFPGTPAFDFGTQCTLALYDVEHCRVEGYEVVVNKPRVNIYRGPGGPQAFFALESVVDEVCVGLGLDPIEFRLGNAVKEGSQRADGTLYGPIGFVECLEAARASDHWRSRLVAVPGRKVGRGVGAGYWANGGGISTVAARLNPDGTVTLLEGSPDIGGTRTSVAMQFAETMGIPVSDVYPDIPDTDTIPACSMTAGSRTTYATGLTAHHAALELRRRIVEELARLWAAPVEGFEFADGVFRSGDRSAALKEAAQLITPQGLGLMVSVTMKPTAPGPAFSVHIADVEVDEETGRPLLTRYTAIQDVGRAVYPPYVEGQLQGGVAQGLGWALTEGYLHDAAGRLLNASLLDYRIPTALDLPNIATVIVEVPNPGHPYGVRGVGEANVTAVPATITNAIHDAVGVRATQLPVTPARLLEALAEGDPGRSSPSSNSAGDPR